MIAAGIKRAGRFKQVSLPALGAIAREEAKDNVGTRAKLHAVRAAREIWKASKEADALKRRLLELGEKELVAKLEAP